MAADVDRGLFIPVVPVMCIAPVPIFYPVSPGARDFALSGEAGAVGESLAQGCDGDEPQLTAGAARGAAMRWQKAGVTFLGRAITASGALRETRMFPNLPGKPAPASRECSEMLRWGGEGLFEFRPAGQRYTQEGWKSRHPFGPLV